MRDRESSESVPVIDQVVRSSCSDSSWRRKRNERYLSQWSAEFWEGPPRANSVQLEVPLPPCSHPPQICPRLYAQLIGCSAATSSSSSNHQRGPPADGSVATPFFFASCQTPPTIRCLKTRGWAGWLWRVPTFLTATNRPRSLESTWSKNFFFPPPIRLFCPWCKKRRCFFVLLSIFLAAPFSGQHCGWVSHASLSSWTELIRVASVPPSHHHSELTRTVKP